MKEIEKLKTSLKNLQAKAIGLNKMGDDIGLVVTEDKYTFTVVWVTSLGGVRSCVYIKSVFPFEKFPAKFKTLAEFMNEPIEFNDWYVEHFGINDNYERD